MNIEEQNRALCKANVPGLYQMLYQSPPRYPELFLEQTPTGTKAHQQGVTAYLGSRYCREAEFEGLFAQSAADTEIIIFFGCLAKDLLRFLRKKFKNLSHVVIVDPTSQFLQAAFKEELLIVFAEKLKDVPLSLYANLEINDLIKHIFEAIQLKDKISVVFSVLYQTLFPEYCNAFSVEFAKKLKVNLINFATYNYFTEIWLNGTLKNYQETVILVNKIQPIIIGRTIIIVSAGPSLKKNVHLLKEVDAQAVVIAVGSSVPILNDLGIRPHFNAGVDLFQGLTFSQLQHADVPLLYGNKIQPETLAAYPGAKICFVGASDPLEIYLLGEQRDQVFITDTGFSIAVSIASLVCKMGAKQVVFIGQDMCMYDDKLHHLEQSADAEVVQTDRIDNLIDIYGNQVSSAAGYWAIKGFLEGVISRHPEVEFVNATEGGLGLTGVRNEMLSQVLERLPYIDHSIKEEVENMIKTAETFSFMDYFEEKNILEDLEKFLLHSDRILVAVEKIGKMQKNKAQKKKIEKELMLIRKQWTMIENVKLYEIINKMLYGVFEPIRIRYGADVSSKDWEKRTMAIIKTTVGFVMPIKAFCELVQNAYYAYKPEKDKREQKEVVTG